MLTNYTMAPNDGDGQKRSASIANFSTIPERRLHPSGSSIRPGRTSEHDMRFLELHDLPFGAPHLGWLQDAVKSSFRTRPRVAENFAQTAKIEIESKNRSLAGISQAFRFDAANNKNKSTSAMSLISRLKAVSH